MAKTKETLTAKIERELLESFKKGKPFDIVYERYGGSKGPFYNAAERAFATIGKWFGEARARMEETERRSSEAGTNLRAKKEEIETSERRVAELHNIEQEYEKKTREARKNLDEQEHEVKRRLEKTNAELRAKDAIISEFKRRGLDPTKGLQILKRYSNLDQALQQMDRKLKEKRGRADKLEERTKSLVTGIGEKEGRWRDLTAKLRLAGQLLQTKHAENQQLEEELSNKSARLSQLLGRIKELGDVKSKLNTEVRELVKGRDALGEQNADLRKAFDADKKAFGAERASLEEGNATFRRANAELKDMVKRHLQGIREAMDAEKLRRAQADAEFEERKKEADEELERWKMEADEDIRRYREACKKTAEEEVRKETAERLEAANRDYRHLLQMSEELRIKNIAMGVQLGETSATVVLLKKKIKEIEHD